MSLLKIIAGPHLSLSLCHWYLHVLQLLAVHSPPSNCPAATLRHPDSNTIEAKLHWKLFCSHRDAYLSPFHYYYRLYSHTLSCTVLYSNTYHAATNWAVAAVLALAGYLPQGIQHEISCKVSKKVSGTLAVNGQGIE